MNEGLFMLPPKGCLSGRFEGSPRPANHAPGALPAGRGSPARAWEYDKPNLHQSLPGRGVLHQRHLAGAVAALAVQFGHRVVESIPTQHAEEKLRLGLVERVLVGGEEVALGRKRNEAEADLS